MIHTSFTLKAVLPCLRILWDIFSIFHQADHNTLWNRVKEVKKSSSLSCCCELDITLWMSELDHKEGWALKNWCFWTVVLEKTLESPLDCKEIKPVNPEGNQPWIFIRGTDAEAEVLIFGYLMRRADSGKRVSGKRLWCWGRPWAGEVGDRGWEGWMASSTQWTWVWTSSGRWWRTGKPGVPQLLGSQRIGHDWVTE